MPLFPLLLRSGPLRGHKTRCDLFARNVPLSQSQPGKSCQQLRAIRTITAAIGHPLADNSYLSLRFNEARSGLQISTIHNSAVRASVRR